MFKELKSVYENSMVMLNNDGRNTIVVNEQDILIAHIEKLIQSLTVIDYKQFSIPDNSNLFETILLRYLVDIVVFKIQDLSMNEAYIFTTTLNDSNYKISISVLSDTVQTAIKGITSGYTL